jgi:hypothetical protein
LPEVMFPKVSDAVRWAEEVSQLTDIGSMWDGLFKVSGGRLSRAEMIDVARTISAIVTASKPFKGMALKSVFSGPDPVRDDVLALVMAGHLYPYLAEAPGTMAEKHRQLYALSMATLKSVRSLEVYGHRYPVGRMAKDIGISREAMYKSRTWINLRLKARDQVALWVSQGEAEVASKLGELGWMA